MRWAGSLWHKKGSEVGQRPDRQRLLFMKNLTLSLSVMSRKTPIQVYYSKMAINISNDLDKRDRFYCDKYTNMWQMCSHILQVIWKWLTIWDKCNYRESNKVRCNPSTLLLMLNKIKNQRGSYQSYPSGWSIRKSLLQLLQLSVSDTCTGSEWNELPCLDSAYI